MIRRPPRSPLFPYTPLSRSATQNVPGKPLMPKPLRVPACHREKTAPIGSCNTAMRPRLYTRSEEHTSELQSRLHLVCRLLLEKKKKTRNSALLAIHCCNYYT